MSLILVKTMTQVAFYERGELVCDLSKWQARYDDIAQGLSTSYETAKKLMIWLCT